MSRDFRSAPLIDVCFLLLVYFMVTTTIKPAEMDLQKQVPGREGAITSTPTVSVMVHVRKDGGDRGQSRKG